MNPRWTALITACMLPVAGLMDVLFYWIGGNAATISAVMLSIRVMYPSVAYCVAYAFGMFLAHVFIPSSAPLPSVVEILARMIMAFAPIFSAIFVIAFGEGGNPADVQHILDPAEQTKFALGLLVALLVGGLVGRFVLCQHPLAGVVK